MDSLEKRKMNFIYSPLVYEIETKFDQLSSVCENKIANQWPLFHWIVEYNVGCQDVGV